MTAYANHSKSGISYPAFKSTPFGIQSPSSSSNRVADFEYGSSSSRRSDNQHDTDQNCNQIQTVSNTGMLKNLLRGSLLRIASDLSGGTPLENIKCRVTVGTDNMIGTTRSIIEESGIGGLWSGTPSRTVEGALIGALFLAGSTTTKKYLIGQGVDKSIAALSGGLVGGVIQAIVMTPAGLVFTALNVNKDNDETAISICKRIVQEKGVMGMYTGGGPMVVRQATNWASRSGFTEIARNSLKMSQYGLLGEIGSGVIGGLGSCWNTPIETVRVLAQRDVATGVPPKTSLEYMKDIVETDGYPGLFRGITPRGVQAIWQTVFMVVFPNMLGM